MYLCNLLNESILTTSRPVKRRRVELSLGDKVKLIKMFENANPKLHQSQLGKKFSIGRSTVSDILKHRQVYLDQLENNYSPLKRRFYHCKYQEINDLVWNWYDMAQDAFGTVTGPHIKSKALEIATQLNVSDFKASNGWLDTWRRRYLVPAITISQPESMSIEAEERHSSNPYNIYSAEPVVTSELIRNIVNQSSESTLNSSDSSLNNIPYEEPNVKYEVIKNEGEQYYGGTICASESAIDNLVQDESRMKHRFIGTEAKQYFDRSMEASEWTIDNLDHEKQALQNQFIGHETEQSSVHAFDDVALKNEFIDSNEIEAPIPKDSGFQHPVETMTYKDVLKSLEILKQFAIVKDQQFFAPVQKLIELTKDKICNEKHKEGNEH